MYCDDKRFTEEQQAYCRVLCAEKKPDRLDPLKIMFIRLLMVAMAAVSVFGFYSRALGDDPSKFEWAYNLAWSIALLGIIGYAVLIVAEFCSVVLLQSSISDGDVEALLKLIQSRLSARPAQLNDRIYSYVDRLYHCVAWFNRLAVLVGMAMCGLASFTVATVFSYASYKIFQLVKDAKTVEGVKLLMGKNVPASRV